MSRYSAINLNTEKRQKNKMLNVAFIPVRGGSKSIPLKNIKVICGKPLVYWTVKAACECEKIGKVYVSTDSDIIRKTVEEFNLPKVCVINRSRETATDHASTESVMLEFARKYEFDNIALIQATSPLLAKEDLDRGFDVFEDEGTDSVLSVVKQKRFVWQKDSDGNAVPTNYDVYNRPRRQEFEGYLVENGAFYITSRENLLKSGNRLSGNMKAVEMCEESFFEIDEQSDWVIVEQLLKNRENNNTDFNEITKKIKVFLTDSDGCLTDAGMYYSENGDELKKFNTRDGYGIKQLRESGMIVGIVTGENRKLLENRARKLAIDELHMGVEDKLQVVKQICKKYNCALQNVAYIGDDINDLEVIKNVGLGCAVADAQEELKEYAKYVTRRKGGDGAIREVADMLLRKCSRT